MILTKGLWISLSLDGIPVSIARTISDKTHLAVVGSDRTEGNAPRAYSPVTFDGLPEESDMSTFAMLYRKLGALTDAGLLDGPFGENHPAVFRQFQYFYAGSFEELLFLLEDAGVAVKVQRIPHKGNDAEVKEMIGRLGPWIYRGTLFDPSPKIEEARREEENERHRQEAEKKDARLRRFVLLPGLFLFLSALLWLAFSVHWGVGVGAVLLIAFAWWWVHH